MTVCRTSTMPQIRPAAERALMALTSRNRVLAGLIVLLCLAVPSFLDPRAIAQKAVAGQEKVMAAKPGLEFKECGNGCPVMIVVPPGTFIMGSSDNEVGRETSEGPRHKVAIAEPFAISKFEVTFEEWDTCAAA